MGLSDEERYAKVYCVIERLTEMAARVRGEGELVNQIDNHDIKYGTVGRLVKLIEQLWPAFLGRTSNSGHWLFGSESSGDTGSGVGLITMAFYVLDKSELTGAEPSPLSLEAVPEEHRDRIEWIQEYWPDNAVTLLDKNKHAEHFVWEAFCWCETYFYAANRYSDKVQAGLKDTTAIICKISGLCFKEFSNNITYLRAWMAKTLLEKVVSYDEDDLVVKWLRAQCAHHDIRADYYDGDLYADFRRYRPYYSRSLPVMERMEIAFRFLGRRFHYEHEHKQLLKFAAEAKRAGAKVNIPRIRQMIARCKKLRDEYQKEERERPYEAYCWITHDTVVHKEWEDDHPPKKKKKKTTKKKAKKRPRMPKGAHHGVVAAPRKKAKKNVRRERASKASRKRTSSRRKNQTGRARKKS